MNTLYQSAWNRFCECMAVPSEELQKCADFCKKNWHQECNYTIKTADELLSGIFLFQLPWDMEQTYTPVQFKEKIDWSYRLNEDSEFTFQMNRHRYWISLGQAYALTKDEKYAQCFVNQMMDWRSSQRWTKENETTTWRTLEAGLRIDYWIRAMALCAYSNAITQKVIECFVDGLEEHCKRLRENTRSGFSKKSNWGVMEYTGLYAASFILNNEQDREKAEKYLKQALHTQIMDDGMQWEASPMYHNEVLMSYLEVLRISRIWNHTLFSEKDMELIRKAAYATMFLQTPQHHQPMVGDSDDTDVRDILTQAALLLKNPLLKGASFEHLDYESIWAYGIKAEEEFQTIETKCFCENVVEMPSSGQIIWRSQFDENATWLYFKNGPLGGGHGHQDKLSVSLWFSGEEILVDRGRYTYKDCAERYWLKSSAAHNVPLLGENEYAESADSWIYRTLIGTLPNRIYDKKPYFMVEGSHSGYMGQGVLVRRRVIVVSEDVVVINDQWDGNLQEAISQKFHFAEPIVLETSKEGLVGHGRRCRFMMQFYAQNNPVQIEKNASLIARHYNYQEKSAEITIRANNTTSLTTVLINQKGNQTSSVTPKQVYNEAYAQCLSPSEAEGFEIKANGECYGLVLLYQDAGNSKDYNGICGRYGLGRTMICNLNRDDENMTVLQW